MMTHEAPARTSAWQDGPRATPTLAWFVRRSVLWAGIVMAAVASACALYAVASKAQPEPPRTVAAQPFGT